MLVYAVQKQSGRSLSVFAPRSATNSRRFSADGRPNRLISGVVTSKKLDRSGGSQEVAIIRQTDTDCRQIMTRMLTKFCP